MSSGPHIFRYTSTEQSNPDNTDASDESNTNASTGLKGWGVERFGACSKGSLCTSDHDLSLRLTSHVTVRAQLALELATVTRKSLVHGQNQCICRSRWNRVIHRTCCGPEQGPRARSPAHPHDCNLCLKWYGLGCRLQRPTIVLSVSDRPRDAKG